MKRCPRCEETKTDDAYYVYNDRLSSWCKECRRKKSRDVMRDRTPEEKAARRKEEKDKLQGRLKELLRRSRCMDCGISDPVVLVFHHRDPDTKYETISRMISHRIAWDRILKEIEKCDCLCANCHFKRHHEIGNYREFLRS